MSPDLWIVLKMLFWGVEVFFGIKNTILDSLDSLGFHNSTVFQSFPEACSSSICSCKHSWRLQLQFIYWLYVAKTTLKRFKGVFWIFLSFSIEDSQLLTLYRAKMLEFECFLVKFWNLLDLTVVKVFCDLVWGYRTSSSTCEPQKSEKFAFS